MRKILSIAIMLALAACTQTVTNEDGTAKQVNASPLIMSVDRTNAVFKEHKLPPSSLNAKSRYYRTMQIGTVSGFDRKSFFTITSPITDADAKGIATDMLGKANVLASNRPRYLLDVTLTEGPRYKTGLGLTNVIDYVVKDMAGNEVLREQQTTSFSIPIRAVPFGDLRFRLEFLAGYENNLTQFVNQLNSR